jgi:putative Mg2+ transporter-C (MgtC) family protein
VLSESAIYGWNGGALGWGEISLRLLATIAAAIVIGWDRRSAGQVAGLRTVILVAVAAALSMIQANLLLPATGKTSASFATLDLMRLPLGILTGIGFIGAGAIVRRGDLVVGVTTAATLWIATVMGLCFGGGQIALGAVTAAVTMVVLRGAKSIEWRIREERKATMTLTMGDDGPSAGEIRQHLVEAGFRILRWDVLNAHAAHETTVECIVGWWGLPAETQPPPLWEELARDPRLRSLRWTADKGDQ